MILDYYIVENKDGYEVVDQIKGTSYKCRTESEAESLIEALRKAEDT